MYVGLFGSAGAPRFIITFIYDNSVFVNSDGSSGKPLRVKEKQHAPGSLKKAIHP